MDPKNNKNNTIFTIDMNEVFPPEWYSEVEKAINFALQNLGPKAADPERLVKYIMDYNINKRIEQVVNENAVNIIPTQLDWKNKDYMLILSELYTILDYCILSPKFTSYKAKITLDEEKAWMYNLEEIGELIRADYPSLKVKFSKLKTKDRYTLSVKKESKSKE